MEPIQSYFSNPNNFYYGHGTGRTNVNIEKEIFTKGLRCSRKQLFYTSDNFGRGGETLFDEKKDMLDNWPHCQSKQIVIVSLPDNYIVRRSNALVHSSEEPFYYKTNSSEQNTADKSVVDASVDEEKNYSNYVRPEFVLGYYDAEKKEFIENPSYYEKLPQEAQ